MSDRKPNLFTKNTVNFFFIVPPSSKCFLPVIS